jgi:hypothetical protein
MNWMNIKGKIFSYILIKILTFTINHTQTNNII